MRADPLNLILHCRGSSGASHHQIFNFQFFKILNFLIYGHNFTCPLMYRRESYLHFHLSLVYNLKCEEQQLKRSTAVSEEQRLKQFLRLF
jgi:hypothetical protein